MNIEPWQWFFAALAAMIFGLSKTGVGGLGMLGVAIFTQIFPATKQVSGLVLPLLIVGDVVAVATYRRHTRWQFLWKLFPWTAAGVALGWTAMGRIDDRQARVLVGASILGMVALHLWRRWRAWVGVQDRQAKADEGVGAPGDEHGVWFAPMMGVLAGFTTLIANAAGPLMAIYLLAMRLPKLEFVGTGAVFFMILNWFKVPFMVNLGLITTESVRFNLLLAPAVVAGALAGRALLPRINQQAFENLALALSAAGGVKLLF
jgi:hypothetical protein